MKWKNDAEEWDRNTLFMCRTKNEETKRKSPLVDDLLCTYEFLCAWLGAMIISRLVLNCDSNISSSDIASLLFASLFQSESGYSIVSDNNFCISFLVLHTQTQNKI